jgi:radical SAM protein with 4Fe4S-binding SPASM domain
MVEFISPWIHTTNRCNLKCPYCYVRGNADMSPDVYDELYILLLNTPTNIRHLRFAGGEPTLVFDIWEPFAKRMLEHKGTSVEVLTNLIAPPKEFWKFAELHNVSVSVSIDNGKSVKVLNRNMAEKLKRISNPWIMTTITKENIKSLDVLAAFIGMNNYGWAITTDYFEAKATTPHWEVLAEAVVSVASVLREFGYDFNKISFNNFSTKANFNGCKAGNEMITIAPNGDIYRCQTEINHGSKIGDVHNGYSAKSFCARDACKKCPIFGLCTGWCPIHYKLPNPICNVIKLFASETIKEVRKNAK